MRKSTEDVSTLILRLRELHKTHLDALQAIKDFDGRFHIPYHNLPTNLRLERYELSESSIKATAEYQQAVQENVPTLLSRLEEQQQRYQLACKIAEGLTAGSGEWVEKLSNGMEISVQTWTEINPYVCAIFQPNGDDLEDTVGGLDEMVSAVQKYRKYEPSPVIDNREGDL